MRQLRLLLFTPDGMPVYHKFRPTFYLCESKEFFPRTQKKGPSQGSNPLNSIRNPVHWLNYHIFDKEKISAESRHIVGRETFSKNAHILNL